MGIGGIFGLDGGEKGRFEEELLATRDEMVFWRALGMKDERQGEGDKPGSPFHMFRKTWIWLATCFFERSTPFFWRKSTRNWFLQRLRPRE